MLNSLEVRSPFLDHRLIEFAFKNIPSKFKVNSKQKKIVLKELCKKILPKEFDHDRKQGFTVPLSNWLKNDKKWKDFYYDILTSNDCIFNSKFIDTLYKGELKGYQNSEKFLVY
jgi:asparagine synthase (glutamine-hydrolysing)